MSLGFPCTPLPFNVTAISPLFRLAPTSANPSLGWAPSCTTPECISNANWSTSANNSSLSFNFWGRDVTFDGNMKGNMNVQLFHDGIQVPWSPSGDVLFTLRGVPNDELYQRSITLKVLDASPDAQLTVTRARVNGSTLISDSHWLADRWIAPSDDDRLKYTGFTEQTTVSAAQNGSSIIRVSSKAGDTVSMQFNGSTFLVHGPCGPSNGLVRVTIDSKQQTVNTSAPFASNDCLLFQAWGLSEYSLHQFLIENVDGGTLGIDRFEFFHAHPYQSPGLSASVRNTVITCTVVGAIAVCSVVIIVFARISASKKRERRASLSAEDQSEK